MDPIVPVVVLTGIIGLYHCIRAGGAGKFLLIAPVYLLVLYAITISVMFPIAHQPNNNVGIFFFYSLTSEYLLPLLSLILGAAFMLVTAGVIRLRKGGIPLILLFILTAIIMTVPIYFFESDSSSKTGSLLPFCQEVNTICTDTGKVLWDTSSEENEWDRMVFFTMKFWLGDRIQEVSTEEDMNRDTNRWMITKKKVQNPVLKEGNYSVIPLKANTPVG